MKAEIVSIGTELLLGEITDLNSSYLASQLPLLGIDLYWITQVGDNRVRLVEALKRAWERSDLIITTGGLGPTEDDITREAIAEMLDEKPIVDQALEIEIRNYFGQHNLEMPECAIKQATIIPSAQLVLNPRGTAPGWWVEREGRIMVTMPGPPGEMHLMWEKKIAPRLRAKLGEEIILLRTLKIAGLTEPAVDEMVKPLLSSPNPTLATYAKSDGVHLRLAAKSGRRREAEEMLTQMEERIRPIFGDHIWGTDEDTLEGVVGSLLIEKELTLAIMESCTGGLLSHTLTNVPGSSAYFRGGMVSYSNEAKVALGVDAALIARHGVVSPEVAEAMAGAARRSLKADIGVGITGVAGPNRMEGKSVGTVYLAIDNGKRAEVFSGSYPSSRPEVKRRATMTALLELRRVLLNIT